MTTVHDLLAQADTLPDKLAISVISVARAERWSFARLSAAIRNAASGLCPISPAGTPVRIDLPLSPALPIAYLAAELAGLAPTLGSAENAEVDSLLITSDGLAQSHRGPVLTDRQLLQMGTGMAEIPVSRPVISPKVTAPQVELQHGDRVMLVGTLSPLLDLSIGCLQTWHVGATALTASPRTTPGQIPLLAARHGATMLAGPPEAFRHLLASNWPAIRSLRRAICIGPDAGPDLAAEWLARSGSVLEMLAPPSEAG